MSKSELKSFSELTGRVFMGNLSINPIALELWTQFKGLIKPILLVAPMMANIDVEPSYELLNNQYIYSEKTLSDNELQKELDAVISHFSERLIPQIDFALVVLDALIGSATYVSDLIPENELNEFGKDVIALKHISYHLIQYERENRNKLELANSIDRFSRKVEDLYKALCAGKYKAVADQVILARSYRGDESVGYTFDSYHSFDDFKKALLG